MKKFNLSIISILILLFISSCGVSRFSTTYSEIPGYYGFYPYSSFYARNLNNYPYYGNYSNFYSYRNFNSQLLQSTTRNYTIIPTQQLHTNMPSSNSNYSPKSIPYKSK